MTESNALDVDLECVEKAQAGDLECFELLVSQYEKRIYRVASRLLDDEHDAEDVLQETFLKAFEKLKLFRRESSFYTWIVQIAVNASLQRLNQRRKWPTVSLDEPEEESDGYRPKEIVVWEEDPEKLFSRKEVQDILNDAITSLPLIYRSVFVLKDIEHLPAEQIARMLGISLAAAKSRLIRARLELRERLSKHFRKKGAIVHSGEHKHA
jgi:RNA polymerase sigma-70 factor (ECF subfamily)